MIGFRLIGLFAAGLLWLTAGMGYAYAAESDEKSSKAETVVIPLDQIWAYDMPGTRDILTLDREQVPQRPLGNRVGGPSSFISHEGKKVAGPGFAVLGTGMEAWFATHEKLPEGQKYPESFPFGSEISVVFFSHGAGSYVHLHRVERQGNVITIRYRFVPHLTRNLSSHFALIPIGKLPAGKVRVEIIRSPIEKRIAEGGSQSVSVEDERQIICKSFSFSITEK